MSKTGCVERVIVSSRCDSNGERESEKTGKKWESRGSLNHFYPSSLEA